MPFLSRLRNLLGQIRWLNRSWTRTHARLLRWSKGRLRFGFFFAGRMKVLALTTTGRKSGQHRSSVVAYLPEGDAFAVVASNAGSSRTPAWWLNLQADPNGQVDAEGRRVEVRAREASAEERDRLWPRFIEANESYSHYETYTDRPLPVVLLEPR
jgi:deazaflavin-dependent oxidoreductase (nitroreductase family)